MIISSEQKNSISLYQTKLQEANEEMRLDVKLLIKNNPEAIVIIAGDHGPFYDKAGVWSG
jgi:hypothetical protein